MEFACIENKVTVVNTARKDPNIIKDERIINHLLRDELLSVPQFDYFQTVQTDIQPFMRKVVTTWMLEVCEEQMCENQVLPLAINYMDRFLCVCNIKRQQLQLLGATCLLIASKIRSTNYLPIDLLCAYTDYSVTYEHVSNWELLVLSKLNWNMSAVTGFDYIDQVIERCSWGHESPLLRRHAHTLLSFCCTEPGLIQTLPSVIAAACISSAVRGLKLSCSDMAARDMCLMLNVNPKTLDILVGIIDAIVEKGAVPQQSPMTKQHEAQPTDDALGLKGYESPQYGQPNTPTEVENVYF